MEMSEFSQHVSMVDGAINGSVLTDDDILELFGMTYRAYTGSTCFREFWDCSLRFREKKPELFRAFAEAQLRKSASKPLEALTRRITTTKLLTVGFALELMETFKHLNLPSCLVVIAIQHAVAMRGEQLLERMEKEGQQALQTSQLLTTDSPLLG